jgi:hypothetical protein
MFYKLRLPRADRSSQRFEDVILLEMVDRPIVERDGRMYVINSIRRDTQLMGFGALEQVDGNLTQVVLAHIDCVSSKLKVVPHYDPAREEAQMCCIRIWEAR